MRQAKPASHRIEPANNTVVKSEERRPDHDADGADDDDDDRASNIQNQSNSNRPRIGLPFTIYAKHNAGARLGRTRKGLSDPTSQSWRNCQVRGGIFDVQCSAVQCCNGHIKSLDTWRLLLLLLHAAPVDRNRSHGRLHTMPT